MAERKKVSRKKLLKEPDEFITFSGRMFQFVMKHKTQLTYAVSIVVALIAVLSGYRFFKYFLFFETNKNFLNIS